MDAKIVKHFKENFKKGVCIKLATVGAHGTAGWPDRLFIYMGRTVFMEMKAPGKAMTPLQMERMVQLEAAGMMVCCVDSAEAGINLLDKMLR